MSAPTIDEVQKYITKWQKYRIKIDNPARSDKLRQDLYNVRNGIDLSSYPAELTSADDEVMAAAEHYFLCRAWVGNGVQPAWQMRLMSKAYNKGKEWDVTPRHNPDNPTTPPSETQKHFQELGIQHGQDDLKVSGGEAPLVAAPPTYW